MCLWPITQIKYYQTCRILSDNLYIHMLMGKIRDQIESLQNIDINQINKFDKFFFLYLLILVLFLVFFDIFKILPLGLDSTTAIYIYKFPLTLIFTILVLRLHIVNIISLQFRNFINKLFGFVNPITLWFFFQILLFMAYINISEIIWLVRINLSQTISISNWYYIITWWIILWMIFQTIKLIKVNKNTNSQILNMQSKNRAIKNEWESFKNLFDE